MCYAGIERRTGPDQRTGCYLPLALFEYVEVCELPPELDLFLVPLAPPVSLFTVAQAIRPARFFELPLSS